MKEVFLMPATNCILANHTTRNTKYDNTLYSNIRRVLSYPGSDRPPIGRNWACIPARKVCGDRLRTFTLACMPS